MYYSQRRVFSVGLGVLVVLGLLLWAPAARPDWNEGDPYKMHYPQLPDLANGIDVMAYWLLADDFLCTSSGPITDIHIWTSNPSFLGTKVNLGIWTNNPGDLNGGFSTPGIQKWGKIFQIGEYTIREVATGLNETWWDPMTGQSGIDTTVFQYNFFIDPKDAFKQEKGQIYWLTLYANAGWKTTYQPWNDVAVYWDTGDARWERIAYPEGTGFRDMAFVITTPTPPSLLLLGSGLLGLGALGWRRRKQG